MLFFFTSSETFKCEIAALLIHSEGGRSARAGTGGYLNVGPNAALAATL
jgi:hypothetical protein